MAKKRPDRAGEPEGGRREEPARERVNPAGNLSSKHRATLVKIFAKPTRPDIPWRDIEALFVALGATVKEGRGSRVRVLLGESVAIFHEPHPKPVTAKGAVERARELLMGEGVGP